MATPPSNVGARSQQRLPNPSVSRPSKPPAELVVEGGTDGNEQLTAMTGVVLLVLIAMIGVTLLSLSEFISVHLFVGLLLVGPVALKMASTGYRFVRYYTGNRAYRRKGPPVLALRLIAPLLVSSTVVVLASGTVLLFAGPAHRGSWVLVHKLSSIVWLAFAGLHLLGHLPGMPGSLTAASRVREELPGLASGNTGRWMALAGACVGGVVLAVLLIPQFAAWTAPVVFAHHHH